MAFSIVVNAIFIFWFGILRVVFPYTVIIIKNRAKMKKDGDSTEFKDADLRNFEIVKVRARITKRKGIPVFKFLQSKGFKEITNNMKLYPVRNMIKQETAAVLYTEDDVSYEYVTLDKKGKLTTLPENVRAMLIEGIKQNAKKWISNPLLNVVVQALPLMAIIGSVILLVVTVKTLVPDLVATITPLVRDVIEPVAQSIREVGCHCNC